MKRHCAHETPVVGATASLARSLRRGGNNPRCKCCCATRQTPGDGAAEYPARPPRQGVQTPSCLRSLLHFFGLHRGPCSKQRIFRCTGLSHYHITSIKIFKLCCIFSMSFTSCRRLRVRFFHDTGHCHCKTSCYRRNAHNAQMCMTTTVKFLSKKVESSIKVELLEHLRG